MREYERIDGKRSDEYMKEDKSREYERREYKRII